MSTSSILRRALLYGTAPQAMLPEHYPSSPRNPSTDPTKPNTVPTSSPKFLQKSLTLPPLDTVSYDLEDSVTPSQKPSARKSIVEFLSSPTRPSNINELSVRINAVSSGLALDDLMAVLGATHLDAIVVPKVNRASDLLFVTDVLRHQLPSRHGSSGGKSGGGPGPVKIIALIESAEAIMNLGEICKASPYLSGLIFAAEDFALDLSLTRTPSLMEFLYARSAIATAARAHNLPSTIDLVCTSFRGEEGVRRLEEECVQGRGLGFNGKQCIHPTQVEVVQGAFAPAEEEVEWAVRVVVAHEKADPKGRGAWTLDGKMIDAPVTGKARSVVARAEKCGFDVGALREKWKGQEPE